MPYQVIVAKLPAAGGCYFVAYPSTTWESEPCGAAPTNPYTVGKYAGDWTAEPSTSGSYIQHAWGEFETAGGINSESDNGSGYNSGTDSYSLQMNTNTFPTTTYSYSNSTAVKGWEQFIFANQVGESIGQLFIQYWLIGYNQGGRSCSSLSHSDTDAWQSSGHDCYATSTNATTTSEINPSDGNFTYLSTEGEAFSSSDKAVICTSGSSCYGVVVSTSLLGLISSNWTDAEWNVFGNGLNARASFNSGTSLKDEISLWDTNGNIVDYPTCYDHSWTSETNNLTLPGSCSQYLDYMAFTESN